MKGPTGEVGQVEEEGNAEEDAAPRRLVLYAHPVSLVLGELPRFTISSRVAIGKVVYPRTDPRVQQELA